MAITRPLKEGSVTTYQAKVAAGFPDILASEMDADLDTIYAAWNGGVGTANLGDGSVTTPKLADGAVTLAKLGASSIFSAVGRSRLGGTSTAPGTAGTFLTTTLTGYRGGWILVTLTANGDIALASGAGSLVFNIVPPTGGEALSRTINVNPTAGEVGAYLPWDLSVSWLFSAPAGTQTISYNWALGGGAHVWRAYAAELVALGFA